MAKITSPFQFLSTVRDADNLSTTDQSPYRIGNVTSYNQGDSFALIRMDGEDVDGIVPCSSISTYQPIVGDRVLLARMGTTLSKQKQVILGRVNAPPDIITKVKMNDQNTGANNTTLQNDDTLFFQLEAGKKYIFELNLLCLGVDAGDLKVAWGLNTAWSLWWGVQVPSGLVSSPIGQTDFGVPNRGVTGVSVTGGYAFSTATSIDTTARLFGYVDAATNAGTFQLKFAQFTANPSASWVLGKSWMRMQRVA